MTTQFTCDSFFGHRWRMRVPNDPKSPIVGECRVCAAVRIWPSAGSADPAPAPNTGEPSGVRGTDETKSPPTTRIA